MAFGDRVESDNFLAILGGRHGVGGALLGPVRHEAFATVEFQCKIIVDFDPDPVLQFSHFGCRDLTTELLTGR